MKVKYQAGEVASSEKSLERNNQKHRNHELLNHVYSTAMVSSSAGKQEKILIALFFLLESGNDRHAESGGKITVALSISDSEEARPK